MTMKQAAWHNLMKKAMNALLEAGAIGLAPMVQDDGEAEFTWQGETYRARGRALGAGESVQVDVELTSTPGWNRPSAAGWLERERGTYLMESKGNPVFRGFSLERKKRMAEAKVEALGYEPTGRFIM